MTEERSRIHWHQLLGAVLEELLQPVGIQVITEFQVAPKPPLGDLLILRSEGDAWTDAQRERLPDGIRHSQAGHVLLEFKYSESVNDAAMRQAVMVDALYRRAKTLPEEDVAFFLVSARQPRRTTLQRYGYYQTEADGVYHTSLPILEHIGLLSLNELDDTLHNAFMKCFATRRQEKSAAFRIAREAPFLEEATDLNLILSGLAVHWFETRGVWMTTREITPETVKAIGKRFHEVMLQLTPQELLEMIPPEELLTMLPPEKILERLPPEERLRGLPPEERLRGLPPEERLKGLSRKEIEAYLTQLEEDADGDT